LISVDLRREGLLSFVYPAEKLLGIDIFLLTVAGMNQALLINYYRLKRIKFMFSQGLFHAVWRTELIEHDYVNLIYA
jgi:hypothetical protein